MNFIVVLFALAVLVGGGLLVGTNVLDLSPSFSSPSRMSSPGFEEVNSTVPYAMPPPANASSETDWMIEYAYEPCGNFLLNMPFPSAKKAGSIWCDAVAWSKGFFYRLGFDPFNTLFGVVLLLLIMLILSSLNINLGGFLHKYIILIGIIVIVLAILGGP